MKLFVPYTVLQPATKMVLTGYDYKPVLVAGEFGYIKYLQERWKEGVSFVNCEHDTIFWCGAVESIANCPKDWCGFGIDNNPNNLFAAGCSPSLNLMKFSEMFIERFPYVWDAVLRKKLGKDDLAPMWHLDYWLGRVMAEEGGVICHQHFPPVLNANPNRRDVVIGPR